jgi:hypothetical protein
MTPMPPPPPVAQAVVVEQISRAAPDVGAQQVSRPTRAIAAAQPIGGVDRCDARGGGACAEPTRLPPAPTAPRSPEAEREAQTLRQALGSDIASDLATPKEP